MNIYTNMAENIDFYIKKVKSAMRKAGNSNKSLDMQVFSLASALRTMDLANGDIDKLKKTTVWESTRYGKKLAPHPVFKILKDAQDSITRQMKALGLTTEDLSVGIEDDPLVDLTKKIKATGKDPVIIKRSE